VVNGKGLPGGCTEDLVHRFYQEQYQLNAGAQNRYVQGSDAVGLSMGYYNTQLLPIYVYLHQNGHPNYAIADDFFQGAFGGSFLNHQWLVAAAAPVWAGAVNDGTSQDLHSVVDANGMPNNYPLYASPLGTSVKDQQETASCNPAANRPPTPSWVVCGDYAVNTTQPTYHPFAPGTPAFKQLAAPHQRHHRRPAQRRARRLGVVLGRVVERGRRRRRRGMDQRQHAGDMHRPEPQHRGRLSVLR
jgi:Phospholipase C